MSETRINKRDKYIVLYPEEIELIKIQIELQAQRRILNSIASSLNVNTLTR